MFPLTAAEQEFAIENHYLIEKYLKIRNAHRRREGLLAARSGRLKESFSGKNIVKIKKLLDNPAQTRYNSPCV